MRPTLLIKNQGSRFWKTDPSVSSLPRVNLGKITESLRLRPLWNENRDTLFHTKCNVPKGEPEYARVKKHTPAGRHSSMRTYLADFSGSSEARMPMASSPMTTPRLISGEMCTMPTTSRSIFTPMYARMITTDFSRWRR